MQKRAYAFATALVFAPLPVFAAGMAPGAYSCWYFSTPRLDLNFHVTGPASYTSDSGGAGDYVLEGDVLAFTSGPLKEAMPAGFTTRYTLHEGKTPHVSFIGRSGAEASFCERD